MLNNKYYCSNYNNYYNTVHDVSKSEKTESIDSVKPENGIPFIYPLS